MVCLAAPVEKRMVESEGAGVGGALCHGHWFDEPWYSPEHRQYHEDVRKMEGGIIASIVQYSVAKQTRQALVLAASPPRRYIPTISHWHFHVISMQM